MHVACWKCTGDPDGPLARYDVMMAEAGAGNLRLHVCLRRRIGAPQRVLAFAPYVVAATPSPVLGGAHSHS